MEATNRKFKHGPTGKILIDHLGNGLLGSPFMQTKWTIEEAEKDNDLIEIIDDGSEKGNSSKELNTHHKYQIKTHNGRYKVYIDGAPFLAFNQIDFKGYYAFKDDQNLFGLDIYLVNGVTIETSYKTKKVWKDILMLLDTI